MRKMHPVAPRDCDCVIELRGPALRGMRGLTQSYNNNVCLVNAPFDVTHQGNIGARQHTLVDL